ncbi:unnamed protein product [Darwinula stevensoni]|uniref:H15 domain-containing protein n=1 Tax=Darwinula stevensoni TaxID=69355 RepID=A0A7R8XGZ5_9CRUS|nr:unnamed protein product [Darwinula stevensoni]CAG0891983.1 unnamed protein product [Darwinula stevensoni]
MSDAPASAASPAKKAGKAKAVKPRKPAAHPKYNDMIVAAIAALKERGGSSRQAILKYIMQHYNVGKDTKPVNTHLKLALKRMSASGKLKHAKGQGASGSFRIAEKGEKVVAKKPKAVKPKKPAGAKKSPQKPRKPKAAKKSPAKPKAAKPKKVKKPKTPKKTAGKPKVAKAKKAKSPKKAGKK